tara:strand:- start:1767 stop:3527 length:1761 start_codon:yes stop_codon:yes gene_type:complete
MIKNPQKKNPSVLLMRPPQLFYYSSWPVGPRLSVPTGLLAIASFLELRKIKVSIYDALVEGENQKQIKKIKKRNNPNFIIKWIKQFESTSYSFFNISDWISMMNRPDGDMINKSKHFGASWGKLENDITKQSPDIIGITNLFRENTEETIKTIKIIRKSLPDSLIVVGGPNATAMPEYLFERAPELDFLCLGDGENAMLDIIRFSKGEIKKNEISNVMFIQNNKPIKTLSRVSVENLDELGSLNYNLVKLEKYFELEKNGIFARNKFEYFDADRSVSLITSRGCPYKCSFCSIHIHAGKKYRRYSVGHILDHLEDLIINHKVKHVHFEDDNLTLDRPRFMRLMRGIIKRKLKFTWDTPNGVFANTINKEMMVAMKKTGCTYLIIGVESGDQWVLDNIIYKQPLTLDDVNNAFRLGKEVGIDVRAFYIIGFPRENLKQINQTMNFALKSLKKYNVIPMLNIARADPGTDMYSEAKRDDKLFSTNSMLNSEGSHSEYFIQNMISNEHFTPQVLERLSVKFHRKTIYVIFSKSVIFLLKYPKIFINNISFFYRIVFVERIGFYNGIIRLFFSRLFFPNAMKKYIFNNQK